MPLINEFDNEHEEWVVGDRYILEVDDTNGDSRAEQVVIRNIETGMSLVIRVEESALGPYAVVSTWTFRDGDEIEKPHKLALTVFVLVRYESMKDLLVMDKLREIISADDVKRYVDSVAERVGGLLPNELRLVAEYLRGVL
jgi:hypothetical protein